MNKYERQRHHCEPEHEEPKIVEVPVRVPVCPTQLDCPCPPGPAGLDGARGARGPEGPEGPRGIPGANGLDGEPGPVGTEGPQGPQGVQGPQGIQGPQGLQGDKGDQGIQGTQGERGPQGDRGDQGDKGDRGDQGIPGIQGIQGERGAQGERGDPGPQGVKGDQGIPGAPGIQGQDGLSGFVSCDFDATTNCYDVQVRLEDGSIKDMELGGCVTLLACGYAGSPKCATNATGTITEEDGDTIQVAVNYTVDGGNLTSLIRFSDTIATGSTTVSNPRFRGGKFCLDVETTGKLDFSNLYDKSGLPTTPEGCTSPLSGTIEVDGIVVGGGQATQINKTTGGTVSADGWENIGSGNYNVEADDNLWTDNIQSPQLFGGIPGAIQGSNFSFIVDTFKDNTQRFTICEDVCYYQPIEFETDVAGNPIPGTGVDSNGNPYTGTVTDLITGQTVSV